MKVCIVGASGKLGQYMVQHALKRGYELVGVCREQSVPKLDRFRDRMTIVPGMTNDREVIRRAVAGCDGVLTVLAPWGVQQYASGTAQAVLDFAEPGARLVFSCGWHITRDGQDRYSRRFKAMVAFFSWIARITRFAELDDQIEATRRIFESNRRWTVVRGSDLEEGESQGLPVWSRHVGDPILASNRTRRIDFGLFMVEALTNDALIQEAPAIVGRLTPSALAHTGGGSAQSFPTGAPTMTAPASTPTASLQRLARATGLLYLVVFACGMFAPIVLESVLVPGDPATTALNVLSDRTLFGASLVGWVVIVGVDVVLSVLLYLLLKRAGWMLALTSAGLRFVYSAVLGAFLVSLFDAWSILTRSGALELTASPELLSAATADLERFSDGFTLALAFFGAHLVSLGILVLRSRYLPYGLGLLVSVAGLGYVIDTFGKFYVTGYDDAISMVLLLPAVFGELGLALWLTVKGVRPRLRPRPAR